MNSGKVFYRLLLAVSVLCGIVYIIYGPDLWLRLIGVAVAVINTFVLVAEIKKRPLNRS